MSNCTGYSFFPNIELCTSSAVGNGNVSDLTVSVFSETIGRSSAIEIVTGWDGTEIVVEISGLIGEGNAFFDSFGETCNVDSAQLTISPDTIDGTTGMLTLQVVISDCADQNILQQDIIDDTAVAIAATTSGPTVNGNCGSEGPHTLVEMAAFDLGEGNFCGIRT